MNVKIIIMLLILFVLIIVNHYKNKNYNAALISKDDKYKETYFQIQANEYRRLEITTVLVALIVVAIFFS